MVGGSHPVVGGRCLGAKSKQESDLRVFYIELALEVKEN